MCVEKFYLGKTFGINAFSTFMIFIERLYFTPYWEIGGVAYLQRRQSHSS